MGIGHTYDNLGSYKCFTQCVPSDMRPFLFGYHISFCFIFAVEVVRGHYLQTHLKMCIVTLDLLPLILHNGTVSGEMGSQVASMPMVIKFGPGD